MKTQQVLRYGLLALALAVATTVASADTITVSFDENGNGTWTDSANASQWSYSGMSGSLVSTLETDPTGLLGGVVLVYQLPTLVNAGPAGIGEPDGSAISDALYFTDQSGDVAGAGQVANEMVFVSGDTADGLEADTGLNSFAQGLTMNTLEDSSGNFTYLPDGVGGNLYYGQSAEAPEPGTLMLLGGGLLGLARKFRKTR